MKKIINYISASLDTYRRGASARKLSAFAFMCCIIYAHIRFIDEGNVIETIWADIAGLLLCLGIVTIEQIVALKNGGGTTTTSTPSPDAKQEFPEEIK